MGQTVLKLSSRRLEENPIFPNRFVVEICEKVHTHYKNLRIVNSLHDWVSMAEGFKDAHDRWKKRGCPGTRKDSHVELCRKKIINESENRDLLINLNKNLYLENEGKVFAEGANFEDKYYIHLKIRDLRIELSLTDFKELANAITEAEGNLKNSGYDTALETSGLHG